MAEEELLIYEQRDVRMLDRNSTVLGVFQITLKENVPSIRWAPTIEDPSYNDWDVVSDVPKIWLPNNADNAHLVAPFQCRVDEVSSLLVSTDQMQLHIVQKGNTIAAFKFQKENSDYLREILSEFVSLKRHPESPNEYMLQTKQQATIDHKLAKLNLVPGKSEHTHINSLIETPRKVFGFLSDMKNDPLHTTLTTLSSVYDAVLHGIPEGYLANGEDHSMAELLRRVSGVDDFEPGYELITTKTPLAERPVVERLQPLESAEFSEYLDSSGVIKNVDQLKKRIFRGGIHPDLRPELWCYLLGYYRWNDTTEQRQASTKKSEHQYLRMKEQWATISPEQEASFGSYRERKTLIEKDVMRIDRLHPFYEGENNPNLETLNDILMTYVMYNFDLGYVQGMSDLLAPIFFVLQDEVKTFWCFVGYMNQVHENFELEQTGMRKQLVDLSTIMRMADPEFYSFLQSQDSASMSFCFRWLLIRFKREFVYEDVMRLWEIFWTGVPCDNFYLLFAVAILVSERDEVIENKMPCCEVLKHVNDLNYRIDLESNLKIAESIYLQLKTTQDLPNQVRETLGLPLQSYTASEAIKWSKDDKVVLPGHAERVHDSGEKEEKEYEQSLSQSYN